MKNYNKAEACSSATVRMNSVIGRGGKTIVIKYLNGP